MVSYVPAAIGLIQCDPAALQYFGRCQHIVDVSVPSQSHNMWMLDEEQLVSN